MIPPLPDTAVRQLTQVLEDKEPLEAATREEDDALLCACRQVFQSQAIQLVNPRGEKATTPHQYLERVCEASHCQLRQVTLQESWWTVDAGSFLAFYGPECVPCALIPTRSGGYSLHQPMLLQQPIAVDPTVAQDIHLQAFIFYPLLPEKKIGLKDIWKFSIAPIKRDLMQVLGSEMLIGLLALWIPIATGLLLDYVVPNADYQLLTHMIFIFILNALFTSLLSIAQVVALMRVKLKTTMRLQSSLWDRLLSLPLQFFRRFTAGDLADRVSGIDAIQEALSGAFLQALLGGVFSILTLALMLYYDPWLAVGMLLVVLVVVLVDAVALWFRLKYEKILLRQEGRLSGLVLQLLTGISKLRAAAAETRAFNHWSDRFSQKSNTFKQSETIAYRFTVFNAVASIGTTMVFFATVLARGEQLSFGQFVTFNAAFGQFFAAVLGLTSAVMGAISVLPLFLRAKPILQEEPESQGQGLKLSHLSGQLTITDLSFRYKETTPWLFQDFNLHIQAGDCVAIVGPSGGGKSTLFRLLLGFNQPHHGHIYFDQHDTNQLNQKSLRSQLGTVLQNTNLMPGTILDNIVGFAGSAQDEERAWQAASWACLSEEIDAMPMKMQTLLTESGKTLSMGQRQRVLIARALAHTPRLLLLDEATSAIDNATQKKILSHLSQLDMTVITIAHRFSTIAAADCIYVLDDGKIVQQGKYDELLKAPGLFQMMAKQQILTM